MTGTPDYFAVPPDGDVDTDRREAAAGPDKAAVVATQLKDDPLGDMLNAVRLTGALFFVVDSTSPWCIEVPHARHYASIILPKAQHVFSYHVTVEGSGFASVPGVAPVAYDSGDILVFPQGDGYKMQSAPDAPAELSHDETLQFMQALADGSLPFVVAEGGGHPPRTMTICGFLGCDARPFNPLLASLPRMLRLRRPRGDRRDLLDPLIDLTMEQAQTSSPGSRGVSLRLSELMFIELLRRYIDAPGPKPAGWLSALQDPPIGRALGALHKSPSDPWTVEVLARMAGLSRTIFAERFSRLTGHPPLRYLMLWRMHLAAQMLAENTLPVAEIGYRVGYSSESAFSRGFKRTVGVSPDEWRRSAPGDPGTEAEAR